MEKKAINSKNTNQSRKTMGQFKTLDEAVQYKTGLVNQLLTKVSKEQLASLAK